MAKAISRIPIIESVAKGYQFFFTRFPVVMRPVIFYFVIFFMMDLIYLIHDLSGNLTAQFVKSLILNFLFGFAVFTMARVILLYEDTRKMRLEEAYAAPRMAIMFKVAAFYALCAAIASYALSICLSLLDSDATGGSAMLGVAIGFYVFLMAQFTSFFAVAMAVKGMALTFVRVAYHPFFMGKIIAIAALTILPFLLLFYALLYVTSDESFIGLLQDSGFAWSLPQGFLWVVGKTIFMAALVTTFPKFLVVPVRKKADEDDEETNAGVESLEDIIEVLDEDDPRAKGVE